MADELAGPQVLELPDLIRTLLRARSARRLVLPVRLPGRAGRAMASGALLPDGAGRRGLQTWQAWAATEARNVHPVESA
jgi:hypothetical protein